MLSGHAMLAAMVKVPELAIDPAEAQSLAKAAANVARHYDLGASQKTLDWISLGTVIASIYGPRAIAMFLAEKKQPPRPSIVVDNG